MRRFGLGAMLGGVLAWFLDPSNGRRRRAVTRDRALAAVRRTGRRTERLGRHVASDAYGVKQKVTHLQEEPREYDDATLKSKVETELFRPADVPKGQIDVNAQNGVIQLRGEVDSPELIDELVERARKIQGVKEVESLLHLPGAEAPVR
ncbi:MAG: BON domain-containing protein [Actinobacteria bacterium]|nr:BON domain-containing protein [Actinomycetota bacterium]